jgi:energy-converting hydrogenase B subunit D
MTDLPGFWATVFDAALCLMIVILAWRVVFTTDLFRAGLTFFAFGLMVALAWARLQAVDVALAEAAIGAGLTGALFLAAFARRTRPDGESASPPAGAANEEER